MGMLETVVCVIMPGATGDLFSGRGACYHYSTTFSSRNMNQITVVRSAKELKEQINIVQSNLKIAEGIHVKVLMY